jgi:uncharacterized DUF497 family protein
MGRDHYTTYPYGKSAMHQGGFRASRSCEHVRLLMVGNRSLDHDPPRRAAAIADTNELISAMVSVRAVEQDALRIFSCRRRNMPPPSVV